MTLAGGYQDLHGVGSAASRNNEQFKAWRMSADPIPFSVLEKPLPHNSDAEQELLGAILVNNQALSIVSRFLRAEHFFHESHRRIYAAAQTFIERGEVANPVTLKSYFENDEIIAKAGGTVYLARLAAAATTVINAPDYAAIIHDLALRRELITVAEAVRDRAYDPKVDEAAIVQIEQASVRFNAIPDEGRSNDHKPEKAASIAHRVVSQAEAIVLGGQPLGLRIGIHGIDKRIGGLHPQDLIILAGRPSMGKTGMVEDILLRLARKGHPCVFFSLEQGKEAVVQRLISSMSKVPYMNMRTGEKLDKDCILRMRQAEEELRSIPLFVDDTGARTPQSIQSEILRLSVKAPIECAGVDYLQLAKSGQRLNNPVAEVTATSQGFKAVAKRLNIPLIVLSQLSRAVESRDDKRPQMSDLRESGAIEQDADIIAFVYREAYYHERKQPPVDSPEWQAWADKMDLIRNNLDFIIGKARMGRIGNIELTCDLSINHFDDRFSSITHDYPEGYGGRY